MNVQSLSVVVPGGCPNSCKFCVSKMKKDKYVNQIEGNLRFRDLYERDYLDRLSFARDNGCNTVILTGQGEPICNINFLNDFAQWNKRLETPFRWIEVQTSGVTLDEAKLRWLRNTIRVSTISLSLSSLVSWKNAENNGTPEKLMVEIQELCEQIKKYDFNLRISLNLTDEFDHWYPMDVFAFLKALGADMVTFRQLFWEGDSSQAEWVKEHGAKEAYRKIQDLIKKVGTEIGVLPSGATRYSVMGMSMVLDNDCMSREVSENVRYLILRENCKLYTQWDDEGSILF